MNEIKKYLSGSNSTDLGYLFLGILFVLLGNIFTLVCGILLIVSTIISMCKKSKEKGNLNKYLNVLKNNNQLEPIIEDLKNAKQYVKDSIRLGNYFIYVKKSNKLLNYEKIQKIYIGEEKSGFMGSVKSCIKVNLGGESDETLVNFDAKTSGEIDALMNAIIARNPQITISNTNNRPNRLTE